MSAKLNQPNLGEVEARPGSQSALQTFLESLESPSLEARDFPLEGAQNAVTWPAAKPANRATARHSPLRHLGTAVAVSQQHLNISL